MFNLCMFPICTCGLEVGIRGGSEECDNADGRVVEDIYFLFLINIFSHFLHFFIPFYPPSRYFSVLIPNYTYESTMKVSDLRVMHFTERTSCSRAYKFHPIQYLGLNTCSLYQPCVELICSTT